MSLDGFHYRISNDKRDRLKLSDFVFLLNFPGIKYSVCEDAVNARMNKWVSVRLLL